MKYPKEKKKAVQIIKDGEVVKDFWGKKKMPSYTKEKSTISDSYFMGWCKSLRDRFRRQAKHGKRQQLAADLRREVNDE
jgi:hypothetical protein